MRHATTFGHICALTALVWTAAAGAQRKPQPSQAGAPGARRFVVIGCVSRAASTAPFVLTDTRGDQPTAYRLEGDASKLDLHVGHTLEVSGILSPSPPAGGGGNATTLVLKVESLTWIAKTCVKMK
jgi:hypothetical protein